MPPSTVYGPVYMTVSARYLSIYTLDALPTQGCQVYGYDIGLDIIL